MTPASLALIAVYLIVLLRLVKPSGLYCERHGRPADLAAGVGRAF